MEHTTLTEGIAAKLRKFRHEGGNIKKLAEDIAEMANKTRGRQRPRLVRAIKRLFSKRK